jgi:hypothetical protein
VLPPRRANIERVANRGPSQPGRPQPDRYEPLPDVTRLPGWIWQRLGRGGRIAGAVFLLALVAAGVAFLPSIQESKDDRARSEERARAQARADLARRLAAEQRPHFARSASVAPAAAAAEQRLAARAELMDDLEANVLADARKRVRAGSLDGPILRVECEPFPRSVDAVGADSDLTRREGRYSCLAVTAEFERTEQSIGGVLGHQYRTLVDFESGRYAYCKISGQAGPSRDQLATTPRACGG